MQSLMRNMMKIFIQWAILSGLLISNFTLAESILIKAGTPIPVRLDVPLSSALAESGAKVPLSTVENINLDGLLIPNGTPVLGRVYSHRRTKTDSGTLDIQVKNIEIKGGQIIPLNGQTHLIGKKGSSLGPMIAAGLILGVPGVIAGSQMKKGKDVTLPLGAGIDAIVKHDTLLFKPPYHLISPSLNQNIILDEALEQRNRELKKKAKQQDNANSPKGSLKIKVGIVLKSGDVKYGAQRQFYLLTKPMCDIIREVNNRSTFSFEDYLLTQNPSRELQDWFNASDENRERIKEGVQRLDEAIIQAINVPEFKNFVETTNVNALPEFLRADRTSHISYMHYKIEQARSFANQEARAYVIAECRANFDAECKFQPVPPGEYYLTTIENIEIGINSLLWDVPVIIKAGKQEYIELANHNLSELKNVPLE